MCLLLMDNSLRCFITRVLHNLLFLALVRAIHRFRCFIVPDEVAPATSFFFHPRGYRPLRRQFVLYMHIRRVVLFGKFNLLQFTCRYLTDLLLYLFLCSPLHLFTFNLPFLFHSSPLTYYHLLVLSLTRLPLNSQLPHLLLQPLYHLSLF
jgi:hypothetical protein